MPKRPEKLSEALREALGRELERSLRGEARFDSTNRAAYASDSSNYRQVPLGVVFPRDHDDVNGRGQGCSGSGCGAAGAWCGYKPGRPDL